MGSESPSRRRSRQLGAELCWKVFNVVSVRGLTFAAATRVAAGKALTILRAWALLKVALAAIPLLLQAQGAVAGQVDTAVGATDHGWGILLAGGRAGGVGGTLEFAPEPYRSSNQGNPEQ